MKVVINRCYGGFRLSDKGFEWLVNERGWTVTSLTPEGYFVDETADIVEYPTGSLEDSYDFARWNKKDKKLRSNPDLIDSVEALGEEANTMVSQLAVIEIPDDIEWEIEDYNGAEWVGETHRTWH